ncbi:MAG: hypothetical protein Q9219_004495 [cf. Caloplaca sp. 3 TL-2023]
MKQDGIHGQRLIASIIDNLAENEPDRTWATIPRSKNLTEGFVDITYRQFGNAINRAAIWLEEQLGVSNGNFETFAYAGEKDLRYPIIAVAAVKIGRKILLSSPFTTDEAQVHLLRSTDCRAFVCSNSFEDKASALVQNYREIPVVTAPALHDLLDEGSNVPFAYAKSWAEAQSDPWIVFHTSGTTGLPKPIVYTNAMMTSLDAARNMPDQDEETIMDHYANSRWYTPLPSLHFVGMTAALQFTVLLGATIVFGPADQPATTNVVSQILEYAKLDGIVVPPSLLESLCSDAHSLARVRRLRYVQYAGAPLSKDVGDKISDHVRLVAAIGSTEAGAWFPRIQDNDDWTHYSFMKGTGIEFEDRGNGMYELVFRRKDEYKRWQQIFDVYPDLDVFRTNDLFLKHPTEADLWAYAGRGDDVVNLSHGKDVHAAPLEKIIEGHPLIQCALIGGEGRQAPFLIVELSGSAASPEVDPSWRQRHVDDIWPVVQKANELCVGSIQLTKELTLLTKASKPLRRTSKGTVARRESLALYTSEIESLYTEHSKAESN